MKTSTFLFFLLFTTTAFAQSQIQTLFKQKRYAEVVAFAPNAPKLGGEDIMCIGQSYMALQKDKEALDMFNQAVNKGYKNGEIYFAKGIAETNLELYTNAQTSFRQSLFYMPNRKKVLIELAACYYKAEQLDSALSTYQKIEKNWGDYYPALVMACQIMHEMEEYKEALECYYTKLPALKKDKFYYKEALESVMRLEWHTFKNYYKAEVAIKNLMDAYPENYEYNMLLMQLYNFTGNYVDAVAQEDYIMAGYKGMKLTNSFYEKGAMIMEQFDTAQYHLEVYRNFQPEMNAEVLYKAYIFNYDGSRALGRILVTATDTAALVTGYAIDLPLETDMPLSYKGFKQTFLAGLFLPEIPVNDTIIGE